MADRMEPPPEGPQVVTPHPVPFSINLETVEAIVSDEADNTQIVKHMQMTLYMQTGLTVLFFPPDLLGWTLNVMSQKYQEMKSGLTVVKDLPPELRNGDQRGKRD